MRRTFGVLAALLVLLACALAVWLLWAEPGAGGRGGMRAGTSAAAIGNEAPATKKAPKPGGPEAARRTHPGAVAGRIVRGTPLAGVAAEVRIEDEKPVPDAVVTAGADGFFRVEGVRVGPRVELVVRAEGCAEVRIGVRVPPAAFVDVGDIEVDVAGFLVVRVRDTSGRPLVASVRLIHGTWEPSVRWHDETFVMDADALDASRPRLAPAATTGPDGEHRLAAAPGIVRVHAEAAGFAPREQRAEVVAGGTRTVEIVLPAAHALAGRLVTSDGAPVPGARMEADLPGAPIDDARNPDAVTDADGRFRLAPVPAGDLEVGCLLDGAIWVALGRVCVPDVTEVTLALPPLGALRGRVLDGTTGGPVAGADVAPAGRAARTRTDADGAFAFERVQAGACTLAVRAAGFRPYPWTADEKRAVTVPRGGAADVVIRLVRGAALAGHVLGPAGEPVSGADVEVLGQNGAYDGWVQSVGRARTDAKGLFLMRGLPPGAALVHVTASGFVCAGYPDDEWDAMSAGATPPAWTVDLPDEGSVARDFVLSRGAAVAGTVLGPDGRPFAGAVLGAGPQSGDDTWGRSGADGRFRIEHVAPSQEVVVSATAQDASARTEPFPLADGATAEGLVLQLAGSTQWLEGRILDAEGAPVPGVWLRSQPYDVDNDPAQALRGFWRDAVVVAPDGAFRLEIGGGYREGDLALLAGAPGHAQRLWEGPLPRAPLEIRLARETVLRGVVVDEENAPVAGALVRGEPWSTQTTPDVRVPVRAVTDARGRFELHGMLRRAAAPEVPEGTARVFATAPGFVMGTARVEPSGADDMRIVLTRGKSLGGRVTDASTGEPVEGMTVLVVQQGASHFEVFTDVNGRWRVEGLTEAPASVTVAPSWMGLRSNFVEVAREDVAPGSDAVDFALQPGLSIAGRIVGEDGRPIAAVAIVSLQETEGQRSYDLQTPPDGTFVFRGLPAATFDVELDPWSDDQRGEIVPGVQAGRTDVVLRARRGAPITVSVLDPAGQPLREGGEVRAYLASEREQFGRKSRSGWESGDRWTIPQLDPDATYDVEASGFDGALRGTARGVKPGREVVVLRLTKAGAITGKVVGADGVGVGGVNVSAEAVSAPDDAPGRSHATTSAADGTFTLKNLGPYRFAVRASGVPDAAPVHEPGDVVEIRVTK